MKLDLTRTGINYLLQSLAGGPPPVFTSIVLGNGADAGGEDATQVSNPLVAIGINSIERDNEFVTLSGVLNNNDIASEFRANEMGVFIQNPDNEGKELLFAYGYVTDKKAMLVPSITDHLFETTENVMVYVGSAENVSAVLTDSLATVSKAEFKAHTESEGNPHNVSKEDVGLGNVPNVSTNDQTPTYTVAKELAALTSGEKLSTLLGKVAKGISSLIAHLKDFDNPHKMTLEQLEAAPATHQHSTNDITSGILGLARGGLGADNAEDARKSIGAAAFDLSNVPYDVLKNIGKHYWKRQEVEVNKKIAITATTVNSYTYNTSLGSNVNRAVYYSDDITLDIDYDVQKGRVTLKNPQRYPTTTEGYKVCEGKYISLNADGSEPIYYVDSVSYSSSQPMLDNVFADMVTRQVFAVITLLGDVEYLYGENVDTYPHVTYEDDYQYSYLGIIENNILNVVKMQLISYVGTGTRGADNPCSITFDFKPAIVYCVQGGFTNGRNYINCDQLTTEYQEGKGFGYEALSTSTLLGKKSADGRTLSWYCSWDSDNAIIDQYNGAGATYYYLGIQF